MTEEKQKEETRKPSADELLSKHIGDIHYRAFRLKEYFDNLNDIVHYYLDKFGPYMPMEDRTELAILALKADKIFMDLSALIYDIQVLRSHAQAHIDNDDPDSFSVTEELVEHLERGLENLENEIASFSEELEQFIDNLQKTAEREGIA